MTTSVTTKRRETEAVSGVMSLRCTSVLPTLRVAILPTFRVAILPTAFLVRLQFFRQLFCTLLKLYIAASRI